MTSSRCRISESGKSLCLEEPTPIPKCLTDGVDSALCRGGLAFLAKRAARAYETQESVGAALEANGGTMAGWWDVGSTEAFLAVFGDASQAGACVAVLAFRGTQLGSASGTEWLDVAVDLAAWKKYSEDGLGAVHAGFVWALEAAWSEILPALTAIEERAIPLYITGHSLGGALAVLAAARWPAARAVVTLGCPRVGDADFAAWFHAFRPPHYRIVRGADVVPWLPLFAMSYRHDGPADYLPDDGTFRTNLPGWKVAVHALRSWRPGRAVGDHAASGYVEALVPGCRSPGAPS